MGRRAVVLVSNDLSFDQRVRKTVATLEADGWEVDVVGRLLPNSVEVPWTQRATRYPLRFTRGKEFYAELTWVLTRDLMRRKEVQLIWANDLDTLLPARIAGWRRRIPVVYDSHEFFTEAEALSKRRLQRLVWLTVERLTMPRCRSVITVNESIAEALAARYPRSRFGRPFVVRNMPMRRTEPIHPNRALWAQYGVPADRPIVLMQGAFIDRDRGGKIAVNTLEHLPDVTLVLIGAGKEFDWAREQQPKWSGRLHCIPKLPYAELFPLTASADVGLSLDQGLCGNFYFSLPNKLFDYIQAGLPVVATDLPEVSRIVNEYEVGQITPSSSPQAVAETILTVLATPRATWRTRCERAAEVLNWESDSANIKRAIERSMNPPSD